MVPGVEISVHIGPELSPARKSLLQDPVFGDCSGNVDKLYEEFGLEEGDQEGHGW